MTIGLEIAYRISLSVKFIKQILPTYLGGSAFVHHLSCLLYIYKDGYVILEYGGIMEKMKNAKIYFYYWNQDGLRFSLIDFYDYQNIVHNSKEGSLIINDLDLMTF